MFGKIDKCVSNNRYFFQDKLKLNNICCICISC